MTRNAQVRFQDRAPAHSHSLGLADSERRNAAERGCRALLAATLDLYDRYAARFGSTPEAARIALNYSPDDIRAHMARAA